MEALQESHKNRKRKYFSELGSVTGNKKEEIRN